MSLRSRWWRLSPPVRHCAQHQVTTRSNVEYVEHDGVKLTGDLYMPKDVAKAPVVIGIHGGGWQGGSPAAYRHWGPLYAKNGIGMFAISYRLGEGRHLSEGGL